MKNFLMWRNRMMRSLSIIGLKKKKIRRALPAIKVRFHDTLVETKKQFYAGKFCRSVSFIVFLLIFVPSLVLCWPSVEFVFWKVDLIGTYPPPSTSQVYSSEGKIIAELSRERRKLVSFSEIPTDLVHAFLSAEDARFFNHWGFDPLRIGAAMLSNIKKGRVTQGGSTITQQLAREYFLSRKKTYFRKLNEIILARIIEAKYSKEEIFSYWLNKIYLGYGSYGIVVAAESYFGKKLEELNLTECAYLASLPKMPGRYFRDPEKARNRMAYVLNRMTENGFITKQQATEAYDVELSFASVNDFSRDYFTEYIRLYIEDKYGKWALHEKGLRVYTTISKSIQDAAQMSVDKNLERWDKRHIKAKKGKEVQVGLISIDSETGYVRAMIGGRNFAKSQWNRAIYAKRQTGSSFKPFVYAAAMSKMNIHGNPRYNLRTMVDDTPKTFFRDYEGRYKWRPKNYHNKYHGYIFLWEAFALSSNVIAIEVLNEIGLDYARDYIKNFGISTELNNDLTLAIGSSEVSLIEMTRAYAVFANGGFLTEPIFIKKIVDRDGKVLEENYPQIKRVIEKRVANSMDTLLRRVVSSGTGQVAQIKGLTVAGKTGTTNNYKDAWFIAYTRHNAYLDGLVSGVWVGYDDNQTLDGGTGSGVACPIWRDFMKQAKNSHQKE